MSFLQWLLGKRRVDAAKPQPDVVLDIDYERGCLYLILANLGAAPAVDVEVRFDPPLVGLGGDKQVSEMAIFRRLRLLRPGKEIRVFLDASAEFFRREKNIEFQARVSWRNRNGNSFRGEFEHDLGIYVDWIEVVDRKGQP